MTDAPDRGARRRTALDAARDLLMESGVSGLSMRRLARESSMAVNTLYAMFSTRDGILRALVEEAVNLRLAAVGHVLESEDSPIEQLDALVVANVRHAAEHPRFTKAMYRAAGELRGLRQAPTRMGSRLFLRGLHDAVAAGELRADVQIEPLAELLRVVVAETSLAWAMDEIDDDALEARCRHALAVVLMSGASEPHADRVRAMLMEASQRLPVDEEAGPTRD